MQHYLFIVTTLLFLVSCSKQKSYPITSEKEELQQVTLTLDSTEKVCALYHIDQLTIDSATGDTLSHVVAARLNWLSTKTQLKASILKSDSIPVQVFGWYGRYIYFRNQFNQPALLNTETGKVERMGSPVLGITDSTKKVSSYRFSSTQDCFLITYETGEQNLFYPKTGETTTKFNSQLFNSLCEKFEFTTTTVTSVIINKKQYLTFVQRDSGNLAQALISQKNLFLKSVKPDTLEQKTLWLGANFVKLTNTCEEPLLTADQYFLVLYKKNVSQYLPSLLSALNPKGENVWSLDLHKEFGNHYQFVTSREYLFLAFENGIASINLKTGKVEKQLIKKQ